MALAMRNRPYGYSKMDKEDPEERIHRRAQFLIYKAMDRADSYSRKRPSYLRIRIRKLKVRIGKRLTRLRKGVLMSISAAKASVCRQVCSQFKTCKRLFGGGDDQITSGNSSTINVGLPPLFP